MIPIRSLLILLLVVGTAVAAEPTPLDLSAYPDQFDRWEPEITKLEKLDGQQADPSDAVLLIGSSSIRLWETAAADLAPNPVIRRGFGGARFSDLAYFAKRLITPHEYRAVVIFVGNDVTGSPNDIPPAETARLFDYVVDVILHHQPDAQVICCDVRPAPSRFHLWDEIQRTNAALEAECEERPNVHYLNTTPAFLTDDGSAARPELHRQDRLHLNADGYALWSKQIKDELDRVLKQ